METEKGLKIIAEVLIYIYFIYDTVNFIKEGSILSVAFTNKYKSLLFDGYMNWNTAVNMECLLDFRLTASRPWNFVNQKDLS